MYQKVVLILILLSGDLICKASEAESWILFARAMKQSWKKCSVDVRL